MISLMTTNKVSDVIVSFLLEKGITTVFGIIGSANSHIYNSCGEAGITIINTHNEQAALLAAGAYYRTCGKLALALVTAGGGVTNAITGVVSLWADSIPTIIISGQEKEEYVEKHAHRRMYGTQGLDIVHMVSKTTKYAKLVKSSEIYNELEHAYQTTLSGRKGPVWLDIPFDVQSKQVPIRLWKHVSPKKLEPTSQDMTTVINLIKDSKRPVILAGHGVKLSKSGELFKSRVKSLNIPTLVTWSAIDILDHTNPLFFGSPGVYGQRSANFIFQKCDLLITIGSRLTIPQTGYDFKEVARNATIVMIDVDETEFKEFVDLPIKSDCGTFLEKLSGVKSDCETWIEECRQIRNEFPIVEDNHIDDTFPNSYKLIDKISNHLKPDQIIVTDMGTALLSGHQSIRLGQGMTMFSSYGLGEMGYGLPAAFGAAIAGNGREVLCLNCDGGMMMNIQELQTIVQHGLRVKIVIFNNDGYLMIKHTQKMLFGGNYNAVDKTTGIVLPDYMKVAKAFGYEDFRIKTWEEFDFYFTRFMDHDGPAICEIFMPPNQDFLPKVKGVLQSDGSIFAPPIEEMSPVLPMETIERIMGSEISTKSSMIVRTSEKQ
jgi:acetolactate synthase-1/2/3 large subunit